MGIEIGAGTDMGQGGKAAITKTETQQLEHNHKMTVTGGALCQRKREREELFL